MADQRPIQWKSTLASAFRPSHELALLSQGDNRFIVFNKKALKHEIQKMFAFMLGEINLTETASMIVGEGMPFKNFEELMKCGLKIGKAAEVERHKARQAETKEKKKS